MGWVGFGVFLVSVSYILYKHPPHSWDFVPWPSSQRNTSASTPGPPRHEPEPSHNTPTVPHLELENEVKERDSPEDDAEPTDTTPKAIPAAAPPGLNIPVLNLDQPPMSLKSSKQPPVAPSISSPIDVRPPPDARPSLPGSMPPPPRPSSLANNPAGSMPPPPRPSLRAPLRPPPSSASSLRVPPSRTPPTSRLSSSTLSPFGVSGVPQKSSRQVVLEPGHSPLDWAALTSNPRSNLRGENVPPGLLRVTPSMLKAQNGRKGRDAWTSYQGKVYNITPYLPFHPGGKGELLRGVGKDSEKLFLEVHPWVNWDGMLGECMVGILVSENEPAARPGTLDEMD
ncbi:hypothetical protein LOZ58_003243 [Ophidiomyces ophidiicola]|nr:hypothetical protein LOZ58_003243 [Ophidiomyces ophidiicola]